MRCINDLSTSATVNLELKLQLFTWFVSLSSVTCTKGTLEYIFIWQVQYTKGQYLWLTTQLRYDLCKFYYQQNSVITGKVYFPEFQQLIVVYFFKYASSHIQSIHPILLFTLEFTLCTKITFIFQFRESKLPSSYYQLILNRSINKPRNSATALVTCKIVWVQ